MPVRSSGHLQEHLQDRHHLVPLWRPTLWHEVRILDLRRQPGTLLSPLNTKHAQSTHKAPKKKKKKEFSLLVPNSSSGAIYRAIFLRRYKRGFEITANGRKRPILTLDTSSWREKRNLNFLISVLYFLFNFS